MYFRSIVSRKSSSAIIDITFYISSRKIFPTIRHHSSGYPCHISDNYFFYFCIIMEDFTYMAITSEFSSCIINNQCSLVWNQSNFISGIRCIFTSIYCVSSPCSLLCLFIDKGKKFWRNPCCSIGTVSFCK